MTIFNQEKKEALPVDFDFSPAKEEYMFYFNNKKVISRTVPSKLTNTVSASPSLSSPAKSKRLVDNDDISYELEKKRVRISYTSPSASVVNVAFDGRLLHQDYSQSLSSPNEDSDDGTSSWSSFTSLLNEILEEYGTENTKETAPPETSNSEFSSVLGTSNEEFTTYQLCAHADLANRYENSQLCAKRGDTSSCAPRLNCIQKERATKFTTEEPMNTSNREFDSDFCEELKSMFDPPQPGNDIPANQSYHQHCLYTDDVIFGNCYDEFELHPQLCTDNDEGIPFTSLWNDTPEECAARVTKPISVETVEKSKADLASFLGMSEEEFKISFW